MYEMGNRSLFFVACTLGFAGTILVYQSGVQVERVVPDFSTVGATFIELLVRDLAPTMTALMLATRVGGGIAAELGSMTVTEQVDALRMCGADPLSYLVAPRIIACTVMTVTLSVYGGMVALVAGYTTAHVAFGVSSELFFSARLVGFSDLACGTTKALMYGFAIPSMSSRYGLAAGGGSDSVGDATTLAVVGSSLAVIALNFVVSGLFYAFTTI